MMKMLKKSTVTLIASISFFTMAVAPITANANFLYYSYDRNEGYIPKYYEISSDVKYCISYDYGYVFKSVDTGILGGHSFLYKDYQNDSCSTLQVSFAFYDYKTAEEVELIIKFLAESYPEITTEVKEVSSLDDTTNLYSVLLNYNNELTLDEKIDIAVDIKANTGISCAASYTDNYIVGYFLGDINDDRKLTVTDAAYLLSYYADSQSEIVTELPVGEVDYEIIGDYNFDGQITPSDAAGILEYYADQQTKQ